MKKKMAFLAAVMAMMMALSACGSSKPAETQAPETEAQAPVGGYDTYI